MRSCCFDVSSCRVLDCQLKVHYQNDRSSGAYSSEVSALHGLALFQLIFKDLFSLRYASKWNLFSAECNIKSLVMTNAITQLIAWFLLDCLISVVKIMLILLCMRITVLCNYLDEIIHQVIVVKANRLFLLRHLKQVHVEPYVCLKFQLQTGLIYWMPPHWLRWGVVWLKVGKSLHTRETWKLQSVWLWFCGAL